MPPSNHLPDFQPGQICSAQLDFLSFSNADSFHPHKSERSASDSIFSEPSALFSFDVGSQPLPRFLTSPIRNRTRMQPSAMSPSTASVPAADPYGGILDSPYVVKHHPLRLHAPPSPPPTIPTPTQDLPPTNGSPWCLDDVLMDDDSNESEEDNATHDARSAAPAATASSANDSAGSSPSTLESSRLSPKDASRNDSNTLLSPLTSEWETSGISDLAMSPIASPMLASSAFAAAPPLPNKGSVFLTTPNITFSRWDADALDAVPMCHTDFFPFFSPPASPLSDFQGQSRARCASPPLSITLVGKPPGTTMQFCPEGHHLRIDLATPHVYHIPAPPTTQPSLLVYKQEESANTASNSTIVQSPTLPLSPVSPTTPPNERMLHYQDDDRLVNTKSDGGSVANNSDARDSGIDTGSGGLFHSPNDEHSEDLGAIHDSGHPMPQPFESLFHRPPLDFDDEDTYECPSSPASFGHLHSPLPPEDEEMDQDDTILSEGLTNEPISLLNWDNFDDVGGMDGYAPMRITSTSPSTTSPPPSPPPSLSSSPVHDSSPRFTLTTLPGAETDDPFELAPLIFPSHAAAAAAGGGARPQLARSHSDPEKKKSMFFHPSASMALRAMSLPVESSLILDSAQFDSLGLDLGPSNRHHRGGSSSISSSSSSSATQNPPRSPSLEEDYLDPNVIAEHATDQPELDRLYEIRMKAQEAAREARRWESLANATAARGVKSGHAAYPGYPDNAWATPWSFGTSSSGYRSQSSGWSATGGGGVFGWTGSGEPSSSGLGLSGVGMELGNLGPAAASRWAQEAGRVRKREKEKCREVSTFLRLKLSERGVQVGPTATRSPDESGRTKRKGKAMESSTASVIHARGHMSPKSPPAPHSTLSSKKLHASISTMEQLVARMFLRRNEMQMQRSPGSNSMNIGFGIPPGLSGSGGHSQSPMGGASGTSATGSGNQMSGGSSGVGEKKFGPVKSPLRQCVLPQDLETQETEDEADTGLNREEEQEDDKELTKKGEVKEMEMDIDHHTVPRTTMDSATLPTTTAASLERPLDSASPLLSPLSSSALSSANLFRFGSESALPSFSSTLTALPLPCISPLLNDLDSQDMQLDHDHDHHRQRDCEGSRSALLPDMDLETEPDSLNLSLFGF